MTALYSDTHPKMEALQIQLWRQASTAQLKFQDDCKIIALSFSSLATACISESSIYAKLH